MSLLLHRQDGSLSLPQLPNQMGFVVGQAVEGSLSL
jgi:hypothetical protein